MNSSYEDWPVVRAVVDGVGYRSTRWTTRAWWRESKSRSTDVFMSSKVDLDQVMKHAYPVVTQGARK